MRRVGDAAWMGAGWLKPGRPALHVGRLPGRKHVAVYTHSGSVIDVLAYCRSEDDAQVLVDLLDWLIPTKECRP